MAFDKKKYNAEWRNKNKDYVARELKEWKAKHPAYGREHQRRKLPTPTRPEPEFCEGCGRVPETVLCLDHDHISNTFRGWLCHSCNRALGALGDSVEGVERILAYLKRS